MPFDLKINLTLDLDSPYSFTYFGKSSYLQWYSVALEMRGGMRGIEDISMYGIV